ncbi:MAG: replicative DNA helicase, partial [Alphaproteobacteria bacterium]
AEAALKRDGNLAGVATHLDGLDKLLGGLHPSDLIIIAGRPGMGKSALATNIAFNAASRYREETDEGGERRVADGAVVVLFSLEMSAEQLATRLIAQETEISSHDIRTGKISTEEYGKLVDVTHELSHIPLFIDDTAGLTISQLRTRARRLKRQHNLSLIVIDYLQLLRPGPGTRYENRVQELSEITRTLKQLAKELEVPVIALSQLSRQVENREDKRPQLADLRESGSIEQDADVVMFIYREEYYLRPKEPAPDDPKYSEWQVNAEKAHNKADIIVAKQRHGPTGVVQLFFNEKLTKFGNLDTAHDVGSPAY